MANQTRRVNGSVFSGVCKFWNAVKGIGFVTNNGEDLFVAQQDLVTGDSGYRALVENQRVECVFTIEDGKTLGKNVTGPNGAMLPSFKDMFTAKKAIEAAKSPDPNKHQATVKWFDTAKNFGFLVPVGGGPDVFFHLSSCLKDIVPVAGDSVEYLLKPDKDGKQVASHIKNKSRKHKAPQAVNPSQQPQHHHPNIANVVQPAALNYPGLVGYPHPAHPYSHTHAQAQAQASLGFPQYYEREEFSTSTSTTGVVKFYDDSKGYGFIVPDHGGPDVHVHKSNVAEGGKLTKGDMVEYEQHIFQGKVQAKTCAIVSATQPGHKRAPDASAYGYAVATKRSRVAYAGY